MWNTEGGSAALLGVQMFMLIFAVGVLLGTLVGGGLCVRYLRREIAADVGPQLRQINLKIETLESVLNLALVSRYAELAASQNHAGSERTRLASGS